MLKDLNGATICVLTGTTLKTNIADYNRANNIKINTLLFDKPEEAFAAAEAGRCDGYTDDGGSVAAARSTMKKPNDWMFIPETIGGLNRRPVHPAGRRGWTRLVKWVHTPCWKARCSASPRPTSIRQEIDHGPGRAALSGSGRRFRQAARRGQ